MTGTERQVFEIISVEKKVSIFRIAQKMGISTDYARLVCQGLERHGYIDILGGYCSISKPLVSMVRPFNRVQGRPEKFEGRQAHHKKEEKRIAQKISKKSKKRKKQETPSLSNLKTVSRETAKILRRTGYKTIEDIAHAPFSIFMQATGISLSQAAKIFNEAKKKIGIIE